MTISTPPIEPAAIARRRTHGPLRARTRPLLARRRAATTARRPDAGFTLSEVLIAATLSVIVLAGVLSAFLFIGRTGFRTSSYSDLEAEVRHGLDLFADDVRTASVRNLAAQYHPEFISRPTRPERCQVAMTLPG